MKNILFTRFFKFLVFLNANLHHSIMKNNVFFFFGENFGNRICIIEPAVLRCISI